MPRKPLSAADIVATSAVGLSRNAAPMCCKASNGGRVRSPCPAAPPGGAVARSRGFPGMRQSSAGYLPNRPGRSPNLAHALDRPRLGPASSPSLAGPLTWVWVSDLVPHAVTGCLSGLMEGYRRRSRCWVFSFSRPARLGPCRALEKSPAGTATPTTRAAIALAVDAELTRNSPAPLSRPGRIRPSRSRTVRRAGGRSCGVTSRRPCRRLVRTGSHHARPDRVRQ